MAQTSHGIYYPTSGDQISPSPDGLAGHFQETAETTGDAIDAAQGRPHRFLQKLTSTSIAHNTWTDMTGWQGYLNDDSGAAGISYSNGALTFSDDGVYDIYGQVTFVGQATPVGIRAIRFVHAGVSIGYGGIMGTASSLIPVSVNVRGRFNSGAVVTLQAYQGSGGSLGFQTAANYNIWHVSQVDPTPS